MREGKPWHGRGAASQPTHTHASTNHTHNLTHTTVQVGIIALNLIGEPLRQHEGPPGFLDTDGPVSHELPYYNRAAGELADLQLDMHVDSVTASRIKVRHPPLLAIDGGCHPG